MNAGDSIAVIDLLFGDSGKGTTVEALTRQYGFKTIVRFNGGPQAAHTVVRSDGRWHTFRQFGSGSFEPNVRTVCSRFMLIDPAAQMHEAEQLAHLGVPRVFQRLFVDERCLIVTAWHRLLGRIRELDRGDQRHGSTGHGVGEAVRYARLFPDRALRVRHLASLQETNVRLRELKAFAIDQAEQCTFAHEQSRALFRQMRDELFFWEQCETYLTWHRTRPFHRVEDDAGWRALLADEPLLFEGAQGVLLDPVYGFPPHVTKTDVTDRSLQALEQEWRLPRPVKRLGVLRGYATRHGSGPFLGEEKIFPLTETHNIENPWQGSMRFGWHHPELLRRSRAALLRLDGVTITCLDQLAGQSARIVSEPGSFHWSHLAAKARFLEPDLRAFLNVFIRELRVPIRLLSFGPTFEDKRFLSSDFSPL